MSATAATPDGQGFDERGFVALMEQADVDEFARTLARPAAPEERALRTYLGDERYRRLHGLALRRATERTGAPAGNVVVLHDVMGGGLAVAHRRGGEETVWLSAAALTAGRLEWLRLGEDGRSDLSPDYEVHPTGIMKRLYGELLLTLAQEWNVHAFCYDWRKELSPAAAELAAGLSSWFEDGTPVHLVAHGLGGLVALTFIMEHPERWRELQGAPGAPAGAGTPAGGGRLLLLGTPTYGSFAVPLLLAGADGLVRGLDEADPLRDRAGVLQILRSWPGLYQMLPAPRAGEGPAEREALERLYRAATYGGGVPQRHLRRAWEHHLELQTAVLAFPPGVDPARLVYVAGDGQPTVGAIRDASRLRLGDGDDPAGVLDVTRTGDGYVTHDRGVPRPPDGREVGAYYARARHGDLPSDEGVLAALDDLLRFGRTAPTAALRPAPWSAAAEPGGGAGGAAAADLAEALGRGAGAGAGTADGARLTSLVRRMTLPAAPARSGAAQGAGPPRVVYPEERAVEEGLTRSLLRHSERPAQGLVRPRYPIAPVTIEIALQRCYLQTIHTEGRPSRAGHPVDAIAVGHYLGARPTSVVRELDEAISRAVRRGPERPGPLPDDDLILTQYAERGTLRGDLGQPFFLPDPRSGAGGAGGAGGPGGRVLAVAGMGLPGRLGLPELTVLVRELCWALGRIGKRHLATVLIGAGRGNLGVSEAVTAWLRGIRYAIGGSLDGDARRLLRVTFVECDPRRFLQLHDAVWAAQGRQDATRMEILLDAPLTDAARAEVEAAIRQHDQEQLERQLKAQLARRSWAPQAEALEGDPAAAAAADGESGLTADVPTRVTIELDRATSTYRFGAITETASIPQREIPLDPSLVAQANEELAAEWEPELQEQRGRFLAGLLIPADLRAQLTGPTPLVLLLDDQAARIHWELLVQTPSDEPPATALGAPRPARPAGDAPADEHVGAFLGTSRGLTRQLRTAFAPPPEPPPPSRRVLRVLVVADPAEDAPLEGAEAEGVEVADLFERFNRVYAEASENRVEVWRLFGPREASRTNVLRLLMLHSFDVFHFAGHCRFVEEKPATSGFVFTGGERIGPQELKRIDRVPYFVFANACESGLTPSRTERRSVGLVPSLAEAFFDRGVTNFVCTAWPVDDWAARAFALTLYAALLGLRQAPAAPGAGAGAQGPGDGFNPRRYERDPLQPQAMHTAMKAARIRVATASRDARTWGAYQHYGNPYFRFFSQAAFLRERYAGGGEGHGAGPNGAGGEHGAPAAPGPADAGATGPSGAAPVATR